MQFMVQQDAAAQGQRQRHRMVGDFGGAVIGYVADEIGGSCDVMFVFLYFSAANGG